MNDEALEEIMEQLSSGNNISHEQCLYLMQLYESGNRQLTQCVVRIGELEERMREIRRRVKGGIEASAALDDEIGVYWQEVFLDMIDKALADD